MCLCVQGANASRWIGTGRHGHPGIRDASTWSQSGCLCQDDWSQSGHVCRCVMGSKYRAGLAGWKGKWPGMGVDVSLGWVCMWPLCQGAGGPGDPRGPSQLSSGV